MKPMKLYPLVKTSLPINNENDLLISKNQKTNVKHKKYEISNFQKKIIQKFEKNGKIH